VRTETRRQLKHDSFTDTAVETYSWAVEHRAKVIYGGIAVAVILALLLGVWSYLGCRDQQASRALASAMEKYNAPVRPANVPASPDVVSYTSAEERARAANQEFAKIAGQYSHTNSGRIARYFAALTAKDMNDITGAEDSFKQVAGSGDEDLASLAKLAQAGLYRDSNKDQQAIDLYKQLIEHPTRSVAKSTAQLQLAELYQGKQPQEAAKLYEQIRKEDPQSLAAEMAARNLGARSR
jgi:predicted negative regulator of RcsB-dependent stress response